MSEKKAPSFSAWKLRRELGRVRQQLRSIPELFTEPWLRRRHDQQRHKMLQAEEGQIAVDKKVALLLVYQPSGLSRATLWTCEHLISRGYAPLVVSNAPLLPNDLDRLRPRVWRVVERPNFGYDFGGYRDGVWLLDEWQVDPDVLLVLNDSIWFPLWSDEELLDQMEECDAEFVGALQLDPLRQKDAVPNHKRPFFGSFFLLFKRAAIQHPAFRNFWRNYQNTSNKYKTIRRGERGLSHALMDSGLRCQAVYTRHALDEHWTSMQPAKLRDAVEKLVAIDERLTDQQTALVQDFDGSETWRKEAIATALAITEKQNVLATAPHASLVQFRTPYLKKARDWANLKALKAIRAWIDEGIIPRPHPDVIEDIDRVLRSEEASRV